MALAKEMHCMSGLNQCCEDKGKSENVEGFIHIFLKWWFRESFSMVTFEESKEARYIGQEHSFHGQSKAIIIS